MSEFSVTIAIPTFNRPKLLRRALLSVENQTLLASEIIVSDNATEGKEVDQIVNEFTLRLPNLKYIKQEKNVGAEENIFSCIRQSKSDLFMWLADDDEISPDCLEEMVHLFKTIPNLVTAVPRWHFYTDIESFKVMPPRSYKSSYWPVRVAKFMYNSTDEFFYGLHKREVLERCSVKSYSWPNQKESLNRIYPYLLDLVISGNVVATNKNHVFWRNHDYGVKFYDRNETASSYYKMFGQFKYLMRRINLQILYLEKVKTRGGYVPVILLSLVSMMSFAKDFTKHFYHLISRRLKSLR